MDMVDFCLDIKTKSPYLSCKENIHEISPPPGSLISLISTDPGLPKIRHSHRFVAVVIQFLISLISHIGSLYGYKTLRRTKMVKQRINSQV